MSPVDRLLLGYVGFASVVVLWRLATGVGGAEFGWLLGMHGLLGALILLFRRLPDRARAGAWLRDLYPLAMLAPLYGGIGILNDRVPVEVILRHDAIVQTWEAALFGSQPSRDWIRQAPSVFWSGLLHLAYFAYYIIIIAGPVALALHGKRAEARHVILAMLTAFIPCYLVFILFPVAGPYYAFPEPTGPVRDVWSASLVYGVLDRGSSVGAAFPSSHVAATVATTLGLLRYWRALGWSFVPAAILLTVGTVYCQMHYAVDAGAGLVIGVTAWAAVRNAKA
ncbi:MAG: phosphatase PAP2 family protein [Gemmatimonadetes bacterium]|nr:phosphatase PAP2 family protein [Gemmatimonadota bacterium]